VIYKKSEKYDCYEPINTNHAGPGGLQLAELVADKMSLKQGRKLIDVGCYRGYQTCFLAKEYGVDIVAIDPGGQIDGTPYGIEPLMENARRLDVGDKILGIKTKVPQTLLPNNYFDYAYTTDCLQMIRSNGGEEAYISALSEIHRILKKGGVLGLGEPMCTKCIMTDEIAPHCKLYGFDKGYSTCEKTVSSVEKAGFKIMEHGYFDEAERWWRDKLCMNSDYGKHINLMLNSGWLSFGYVVAVKE
jgi:cyclopropane fatty-acyl-phospholipid synthase-like methyltransferase